MGRHHALCFSPFGFEEMGEPFSDDIGILFGMDTSDPAQRMPQDPATYRATADALAELFELAGGYGNMDAVIEERGMVQELALGDWKLAVRFADTPGAVVALPVADDETCCMPSHQRMMRGSWLKPHLLDKGPLLALYHTWGDGHEYPGEQWQSQFGCNPDMLAGCWWGRAPHERYDMISEGDSPSFLYLIDKGLRSIENPSFGGWGGRFQRVRDNEFNSEADYWATAPDAAEPPMKGEAFQLTRWIGDWMNDFASRASWCVAERFEDANHAPKVHIEKGLALTAAPGEHVTLHAEVSDPDGDVVRLSWFRYADADTCEAEIALAADGAACTFTVPTDVHPSDTIHFICRASDEGNGRDTYMVNYARIIVTVA